MTWILLGTLMVLLGDSAREHEHGLESFILTAAGAALIVHQALAWFV